MKLELNDKAIEKLKVADFAFMYVAKDGSTKTKDRIIIPLKTDKKTSLKEMIKKTEIVKTRTLKRIINEKKVKKIDLVKIDTEGHELEVLIGLREKINKVKCILVEFHQDTIYLSYKPKKIHNYLIKNNFTLKKVYSFPFTTWEDRFYVNKRIK